jgi:hypothetical protein
MHSSNGLSADEINDLVEDSGVVEHLAMLCALNFNADDCS